MEFTADRGVQNFKIGRQFRLKLNFRGGENPIHQLMQEYSFSHGTVFPWGVKLILTVSADVASPLQQR